MPDIADPDRYCTSDPYGPTDSLRRLPDAYRVPITADLFHWVVKDYRGVERVLRDSKSFSSEGGNMLRVAATRDPAAGRMLVVTDPPKHTILRKAMITHLTPARIAAAGDSVASIVESVVTPYLERGGGDFTTDVAAHIPVAVVAGLLGLPEADRDVLQSATAQAWGADDPEYREPRSSRDDAVRASHAVLFDYLAGAIRSRTTTSDDGLISHLLEARGDGPRLTRSEVLANCFNLLIGGSETSRHAAAGALYAFATNPAQWDALRRSPALLDAAVDEVLRWACPPLHLMRTTATPAAMHDCSIPPDALVTVWPALANRDPRLFERPDDFDIHRQPRKNLTFGAGPHACLAVPLAKLELRTLLQILLRRVEELTIAGKVEFLRSNFVRGPKHLPLSLRLN